MKMAAFSEMGRRVKPPPISWLMEQALMRPRLISLAAGFTDNETLPVRETRQLLGKILGSAKSGRAALQYGTTAGDWPLRQLTAERVARLDGAAQTGRPHSPERTIITNGSQQLLYMAVEALCDPGDIVLVEDPTYFVFLGILQARGVVGRGVRLERDGLSIEHLKSVLEQLKQSGRLQRVKALYLVSYHQNPTGVTTRFEKKAGALELLRRYEKAAGHPIFLLEDAGYRELRFGGADVRSALALEGGADRVIYAGTYSKPFATGVRVGFGILPESLFRTVLHIKGNHDFGSSNLLQKLLAQAIASGKYDRHLAVLRRRYAHKAHVMRDALQRHFPNEVEIWEPDGGLYFWARLPARIKTGIASKFFQAALESNVLYVPGELCYVDDPARRKPNHEMRISYGNATEREINRGVAALGCVLRSFLKS